MDSAYSIYTDSLGDTVRIRQTRFDPCLLHLVNLINASFDSNGTNNTISISQDSFLTQYCFPTGTTIFRTDSSFSLNETGGECTLLKFYEPGGSPSWHDARNEYSGA